MSFLSDKDRKLIDEQSEAMHADMSRYRLFYLVVDAEPEEELILGEPSNPFEVPGTEESTFTEFEGNILDDDRASEFTVGGLHTKRHLTVEVHADTVNRRGLVWKAGLRVLMEGKFYHITSVDDRGFLKKNRLVLELESVT